MERAVAARRALRGHREPDRRPPGPWAAPGPARRAPGPGGVEPGTREALGAVHAGALPLRTPGRGARCLRAGAHSAGRRVRLGPRSGPEGPAPAGTGRRSATAARPAGYRVVTRRAGRPPLGPPRGFRPPRVICPWAEADRVP